MKTMYHQPRRGAAVALTLLVAACSGKTPESQQPAEQQGPAAPTAHAGETAPQSYGFEVWYDEL